MAFKGTKAKAKPPAPPKMQCCPICDLPAQKAYRIDGKLTTLKGCTFFARCEKVRMNEDPKLSAKERSEMFRKFHADICETCRLPKEACKEKKIATIKSRLKRQGSSHLLLDDGSEMTAQLADQKCRPPDRRKYTPQKPDWYVE